MRVEIKDLPPNIKALVKSWCSGGSELVGVYPKIIFKAIKESGQMTKELEREFAALLLSGSGNEE